MPSPSDLPKTVGQWRRKPVRRLGVMVVPETVTDTDRQIIESRLAKKYRAETDTDDEHDNN